MFQATVDHAWSRVGGIKGYMSESSSFKIFSP
jgi:hypothetical protein